MSYPFTINYLYPDRWRKDIDWQNPWVSNPWTKETTRPQEKCDGDKTTIINQRNTHGCRAKGGGGTSGEAHRQCIRRNGDYTVTWGVGLPEKLLPPNRPVTTVRIGGDKNVKNDNMVYLEDDGDSLKYLEFLTEKDYNKEAYCMNNMYGIVGGLRRSDSDII